jgi:hypothetical protein
VDVRRTARRLAPLVALAGAVAGAGLYYGHEVEPADVEVVPVELALPRLEAPFDGYRIAHVSDLHADGWMTPGRVLKLVELVNARAPDLVVITGDFATYSLLHGPRIHHVPKLAAPLRRLRAPDGVLAVLGNHDHKTDDGVPQRAFGAVRKEHDVPETVRRTLAAAGVTELRNTVHTPRRGEAALHLCGVDSAYWGEDRLGSVLEELRVRPLRPPTLRSFPRRAGEATPARPAPPPAARTPVSGRALQGQGHVPLHQPRPREPPAPKAEVPAGDHAPHPLLSIDPKQAPPTALSGMITP